MKLKIIENTDDYIEVDISPLIKNNEDYITIKKLELIY